VTAFESRVLRRISRTARRMRGVPKFVLFTNQINQGEMNGTYSMPNRYEKMGWVVFQRYYRSFLRENV
jgi:hypothetical protein